MSISLSAVWVVTMCEPSVDFTVECLIDWLIYGWMDPDNRLWEFYSVKWGMQYNTYTCKYVFVCDGEFYSILTVG